MESEKLYMLLDGVGNPIPRPNGTEANPFKYYNYILRDAFQDAEKELKNQDAVVVVEINIIERFGPGM